jgi:outer membrane protein TolC/ABC-type uncharacterized transport system substrate-binding protein
MIYKRYFCLVLAFLGALSPAFSQSQQNQPVIHIGIVMDGYWELNEQYLSLLKKEILDLTSGEFDVRFPEKKLILSDWTARGVESDMDRLLADKQVDLIIALGIIASHDIAVRGTLSKPVIAPFILDAELMGFPLEEEASGIKNFNYVNIPDIIVRDVQSFLKVADFKRLAYLTNYRYLDAVPELRTRGKIMLEKIGIDLQVTGVGETIDAALSELSPDIEAVFLGPLTSLPRKEFLRLVDELKERKLPSFSGFDVMDVEQGVLASALSDYFFQHVFRRVALNIQRILLGEEPGSLPVNIAIGRELTINMATLRAIDVFPDWSVLTEANLINAERTDVERKLDLNSTVQEALSVNLDLAAKQRFLAAGLQTVREARSELMPQLNVSALGLLIDKDRAEASFGTQAQRTLSGSITATQVIFSEPAWANLSIQKSLQETRKWDYEQLRLDIALAASTAYLNVLRAKTFERIQKENLRRTTKNLEIARVRQSVGIADPAELYRWESELATNQKAVIQAGSQRNLTEIELNRLLHRPLEEPFVTLEASLSDQILYTSEKEFLKYTRNYKSFKVFRDFMVDEGLKASPELAALDAAIQAQERSQRSASNSLWSPTLALQGELTNIFSKAGAGAEPSFNPSPLFNFPEIDNTDWSIGLVLSFPLFKGGEKLAVRTKAQKELEQLRLQKEAAAERIEQRIRFALHLTGSSFVSIEKAQTAAEAATKSLEVVQNAYETGAVSILFLLDAQNTAYNAAQVAANSVYDFLFDLMEMERSIGNFEFFMDEDERRGFLERMKSYFQKAGISIER